MLNRLCLLLAILILAFGLPSAAVGEEDDPPKGADTPGDDPKPEDPKPEEPKPEDPKGEEPKEEPANEPEAPKEADAPPARPQAPVPTPAGMTYLQAGRVSIGSEKEYLAGLLAGRPPEHKAFFLYEAPYHPTFTRPYFISKFEITNAQYHRFLQDSKAEYDTSSGSLGTVDEISAYLVNLPKDIQKNPRQVVWLQFYLANKEAIWKGFEKRLLEFLVKRTDGSVDELATARKFRFEPLPRNLKLQFYSRVPPSNWPNMAPGKGQEDHPVRFVSYNDAEAFAEWAGMHMPTETEWEWAARGPEGRIFPWGDNWVSNELYANWGGKIVNERYEPTTLPVATRFGLNPDPAGKDIDGDGRSWCGCHHMIGNVAEWTGSWFEPYAGNKYRHNFMGRWVKVIRGGGAGDGEMLVLRSACRNYIGGGPDAPPYPENSFEWVGFRTAAYMKTGRDQLGPIVRRAVSSKKMQESWLDLEHFVGSVTRSWVEPDAEPLNHVYVNGRSHAIVLVAQTSFLFEEGMEEMVKAWKRPTRYKNARGIAKETEGEHPFWTLGVLHTDVPLAPIMVRKPEKPEDAKKKERRGSRGRAKAPPTMKGKVAPGTYLLGIWFGRLTILTTHKEFVGFVPLPDGIKSAFEVVKLEPEEVKLPTLAVDSDLDWANFEFDMPLGGKGADPRLRLRVKSRLQFELGSLEMAGTWIQQDPVHDLADQLYAAYLAAQKKADDGDK